MQAAIDIKVLQTLGMARDRPSPYVEGGRFSTQKPGRYRSAGALGCHTRMRAGFPREFPVARSLARDRPSPYAKGEPFFAQETVPLP